MEVSKLYRHGGSVVMVVPAELRKALDWHKGDCVVLQEQLDKKSLIVKKIVTGTVKGGTIEDEEK